MHPLGDALTRGDGHHVRARSGDGVEVRDVGGVKQQRGVAQQVNALRALGQRGGAPAATHAVHDGVNLCVRIVVAVVVAVVVVATVVAVAV